MNFERYLTYQEVSNLDNICPVCEKDWTNEKSLKKYNEDLNYALYECEHCYSYIEITEEYNAVIIDNFKSLY